MIAFKMFNLFKRIYKSDSLGKLVLRKGKYNWSWDGSYSEVPFSITTYSNQEPSAFQMEFLHNTIDNIVNIKKKCLDAIKKEDGEFLEKDFEVDLNNLDNEFKIFSITLLESTQDSPEPFYQVTLFPKDASKYGGHIYVIEFEGDDVLGVLFEG